MFRGLIRRRQFEVSQGGEGGGGAFPNPPPRPPSRRETSIPSISSLRNKPVVGKRRKAKGTSTRPVEPAGPWGVVVVRDQQDNVLCQGQRFYWRAVLLTFTERSRRARPAGTFSTTGICYYYCHHYSSMRR